MSPTSTTTLTHEAILGEFGPFFEAADHDELRMTPAGACNLIPRLSRHDLGLPNPAPLALVRSTLSELSRAEHAAGMSKIGALLTRTDLSLIEREVLEQLAAHGQMQTQAPEISSHNAPAGKTAEVVDLAKFRAKRT